MQSASSANVLLYCSRAIDFCDVQTRVRCWYWIFSTPEHKYKRDMKAGKFYLVFPTAILQRLFELFFRSWLPGEDEADKQIRVKYHWTHFKGIIKEGQTGGCCVDQVESNMISEPHLTLGLRSACWFCPYWKPCLLLFYLWLEFSRIKSAILIATYQ